MERIRRINTGLTPISVKEKLPEENTYVLARYTGSNWIDSDDQQGVQWVVAKLIKGLSVADRDKMQDSNPQKRRYSAADEDGNNAVPYCWETFGPQSFFGQDIDFWVSLEELHGTLQGIK